MLTLNVAGGNITDLIDEKSKINAKLASTESKLEEAKQNNTDLNHKLNESQFKVSEADEKIANLEEEKGNINATLKRTELKLHVAKGNITELTKYITEICNQYMPTDSAEAKKITSENLCFEWKACDSIVDTGDLAVSALI